MRDITKEQLQSEYEDVMVLLKSIAVKTGNFNSKYIWNSSNTNECIERILDTFAIDDTVKNTFKNITPSNENLTTKLSKCILITDLLKYFSKYDLYIMIYYAFDKEAYYEIMKKQNCDDEQMEDKYSHICETLNEFIIGFISKFQVDYEILKMLGNTSKFRCDNEDAVRILWYNGRISLDKIIGGARSYSEEFTDYIIDHINIISYKLEDGDRKDNIIANIYTIMESRIGLPVSQMFINKHSETIKRACDVIDKRIAILRNLDTAK